MKGVSVASRGTQKTAGWTTFRGGDGTSVPRSPLRKLPAQVLNLHYFFERVIVARHSDDSQRVWGAWSSSGHRPVVRGSSAAISCHFASVKESICDGIKVPSRRSELHCYFWVG
jgi:hypothetical protein